MSITSSFRVPLWLAVSGVVEEFVGVGLFSDMLICMSDTEIIPCSKQDFCICFEPILFVSFTKGLF